jgi:UDP-N-acetylmuramyl pentapeptide phosphotransferase/UDP-N-acetylglucosamine-1-phosphate transferase
LFGSLWLLSIFGNFGNLEDWFKIKQTEIFYYGILSGLISVAFIAFGLRNKDEIAREFGITFLLINIYTRYFEYFWDRTDKAIFFGMLAISFWLIGRKAEKQKRFGISNFWPVKPRKTKGK